MRAVLRSTGVVFSAVVAAVILALTTMTSAGAATALMVGGIAASALPDSVMSQVLNGKFTGYDPVSQSSWQRVNVTWSGSPNLGQSVPEGTNNLYNAILTTPGPKTVVGMSAGSLPVEEVLRQLANNPAAPPKGDLTFVVIADSSRQSFFTNPGPFTTLNGYIFRAPAETQYNVIVVKSEYDGLADLPDNIFNPVAVANAIAGAILLHNGTFFADLSKVPAQNITTTTNSVGGVTTTYLIPTATLPLVTLNPLLAPIAPLLKQMVDAGYSRNYQAAVMSSVAPALTTATKPLSLTLTADPPVNALPQRVETSAPAAQAPAAATAEAPVQADQGLAKAGSGTTTQAQQGLGTVGAVNPTGGLAVGESNASTQGQRGPDTSVEGAANATNGLATAAEKARGEVDQGLATARHAVATERPSRATDLTGNMTKPDQAPPTNPTKHATDVLQDVEATQTTHADNGLSNASEHVKDAGPSDGAASTGAQTGGGK